MLANRPESPGGQRAAGLRNLAGLVTAGLVLGAAATTALRTAGEWVDPGAAEAASSPTQSPMVPAGAKQVPAKQKVGTPMVVAKHPAPTVVAKNSAQTAPARVAVVPSAAVSRVTNNAITPIVVASARPVATTLKPPAKSVMTPPATHMEEQFTYQYNALGRRDPFQSLVGGGFVGDDVGGDAPPDVGGLKVVGIVWGTSDKFALVEDARGNSMVLRQGDKIMNGVVQGLKRDAMVVHLTVDGLSQTVTIPLTRKGENSNANR